MRFRNRYTDGLYKKMLNSEFLEVSIFCICRFLRDEPAEINATKNDFQQTVAVATQDELPTGATRQEVLS